MGRTYDKMHVKVREKIRMFKNMDNYLEGSQRIAIIIKDWR